VDAVHVDLVFAHRDVKALEIAFAAYRRSESAVRLPDGEEAIRGAAHRCDMSKIVAARTDDRDAVHGSRDGALVCDD